MSEPWRYANEWEHLPPELLFEPWDERRWRKQRKPRKPNIRKMVADAEKTGKSVSSVTLPDGTVFHFGGEQQTIGSNELDRWIAKHAN